MKKVEFIDDQFILREEPIKNFVKPSKGDFIRIEETSYEVEMIVYNYDKEKLTVVLKEFKK